jgi:DNA polymerase III delta' subunit
MGWNDVLGHEVPKRLLQAHVRSGRVAGAYLFAGPEGVGKRRLAMEMAKALTCQKRTGEGAPCDACPVCRQMTRLVHPDLHVVGPSGASGQIRLEPIQHLLGRLAMRPFSAAVQVAIIDGVERLTDEAANSLLKMLEEPTSSTRWLLITSALGRCLPTITSRCHLIRFRRLPTEVVQRLLTDGGYGEETHHPTMARLAEGSAARAIELAGRWSSFQRLMERFATAPTSDWAAQPLPETPEGLLPWLDGMTRWLRDVAVIKAIAGCGMRDAECGESTARWVGHTEQIEAIHRQAQAVDLDQCVRVVERLAALRESLEQFVSPRLIAALAREQWLSLVKREA